MATVLIPISRAALRTRTAISPRFAMRIFLNMRVSSAGLVLLDFEQALTELDRGAGLHQALHDRAGDLGLDLVHQLHGLDDAERLARLDCAADVYERLRVG